MRGRQSVIVIFDLYGNAATHFNRWAWPYTVEAPYFCWWQITMDLLKCLLHMDVCDLVRTRPQYWHDGQRINKLLQSVHNRQSGRCLRRCAMCYVSMENNAALYRHSGVGGLA